MRDYLYIGSSPPAEDCVQLSDEVLYQDAMIAECNAYIKALRKVYGEEPGSARLKVKREPYDSGDYFEVVCFYDVNDHEAAEYAFKCESGEGLQRWSDAGMSVTQRIENGVVHLSVKGPS